MLTVAKKFSIEASAKELLSTVYPDLEHMTPPIDLVPILHQYGIDLKYVTFNDPTISGAYDKDDKVIYVAKDDPYTRKSFTIAHELGHFILHQEKDRELFYRQDIARLSEETRNDDTEANWFAAALLMPESLIKKYWALTKDVDKLSTIFGISPTAVYFRLKNLHLTS